MIKAIIFDMNGVIIDDEHIHELAFKKVVVKYGITLEHDDYLDLCAGRTDKEGFENIGKYYKKDINIEGSLSEKSNMYLQLFPNNKRTYPGVINLIKNLRNDYRLALTSSSSRREVDLVIKEFDLKDSFEVTIAADDITKGKPDPEPYLLTSDKLLLEAQECVVIEDSKSGVLSAKAANMKCIAVTTTHNKSNLKDADEIVDNFDKIVGILRKWMGKDKITKNA